MYLEQRIEKLEALVAELMKTETPVQETPAEETPAQETPVQEETPAKKETKPKTINDVREATSAVIKADSNKKQAVRDLLADFGAAKVTDLKEDQYADFITKVAEV